jgi:threonine/homoserine/homoserine lactone efflux protein
MSDLDFWWRGLFIGFAIAAPVGPIGLLCIQRTLNDGLPNGLISGLGAATADALYGCVAAFGLTLVSSFLVSQSNWLRLLGGLFLCYLGVRIWFSRPATQAAQGQRGNLLSAYLSTLVLTITNPITILYYVGIFVGLGLAKDGADFRSAVILVIGVFIGSAAWWLTLSGGVALLRNRITPALLGWVNRLSGVAICVFGLALLASLLWSNNVAQ